MQKRQLIEAIREVNSSASLKFLSGFDEAALQQYLDHLNQARSRQTRHPRPASARSEDRLVA